MKETKSQVKREPPEWEKIFAKEATRDQSLKYTNKSCSSVSKSKQHNQIMGRRSKETFL